MKLKFIIALLVVIVFFWGFKIEAEATLIGPLNEAQFRTLNSGAEYGPPPALGFPDGPTTVQSGEDVSVSFGPRPGQRYVDALLFVLSYDPSFSTFDSGTISFSLDSESENINKAFFFTTQATGFPNSIGGIGNGEVGGVKFPNALHAGLVYDPFSGGSTDNNAGIVNITSPIPLRVDIFSLENFNYSANPGFEGTIIGNTPNSHALGVGDSPVPEPATMLLLGSGLLGIVGFGRKKFFKK